ncbi:MAG: hypothetical protein R2688_07480 [Fimbriimonadaceae bacterium]
MKVVGRFLFLIAAFAGFFLVGFFVRDAFAKEAPNGKAFARLMGNKSAQKTPTEVFSDNLDIIAQNAAVQPDPLKLRYSAMTGLVSSLGDPHTNFLEPVIAEALALDTRGNFKELVHGWVATRCEKSVLCSVMARRRKPVFNRTTSSLEWMD